ncbi:MAG: HNH endonuclease [Dehalococcoidia bacterium]
MPDNSGNRWSREDLILAFNLYCRIPFGRIHLRNPEIIDLANLLGRTPGAVSYKLANLSRLDPALQARGIRGAPHGARADVDIWDEFAAGGEALAFESERLLAERAGRDLLPPDAAELDQLEGVEREVLLRTRVNQGYFRRMVLARYNFECCITGLGIQTLLVASHIVPWAKSTEQRLNPRNGLCLNALHDRAFDRGLLTVTADLRVQISSKVNDEPSVASTQLLQSFDGQPLLLHSGFTPDPELLAYHREEVFQP